jgi:hypothetical protein
VLQNVGKTMMKNTFVMTTSDEEKCKWNILKTKMIISFSGEVMRMIISFSGQVVRMILAKL